MNYFYFVLVLFFISINLRPAITSVGPLLDIIKVDLGMSGVAVSLLTTLPVFVMGLFALIAVKLGKRLGTERALFVAMIFIFVSTFLRAFTANGGILIATSFVAGIGIAIAGPLVSGFIKKYFPGNSTVTGIYSVSIVIGASIGSSFTAPLFERIDHSWQAALSFWSILGLIATLLLIPILKKRAQDTTVASTTVPPMKKPNKHVYLSMFFFGCMAAIFFSITAWLAPIIKAMGYSHTFSGWVLTLFAIIQVPVSFIIPTIVSKRGNRKKWLLFCGFSELIGVVLLLLHFSPWVATVFIGVGAGGLFPLALLIPIEESKSVEEATSWSAMMQFGGFMIGALGPVFIGFTVDHFHPYKGPLFVLLLLIIAMLVIVSMIPGNKKEQEKIEHCFSRQAHA
ncbi:MULTISPECIES: MFS transporter [unclassified Virgibacillus]|uniref:MFS transporter n=1 Tax=unclassified Virgibacillus TaxID=2620237 RepID=UPI0024DE1A36|nr:MFS transporter [Virgibacillus sp. LDC-1]